MKAMKYSAQREAIKTYLYQNKTHPTADAVYEGVRKQYPRISLGTVYRNLALLSDMGEILCFTTGDGKDHFDGDTTPHFHFICKSCGAIHDIRIPEAYGHFSVSDFVSESLGASVQSEWTYLYGTCADCLSKEGDDSENAIDKVG